MKFTTYLNIPDTSMPTKITLTGIQMRINFKLSFSTETMPDKPKRITTRELIRFCRITTTLKKVSFITHKKNYPQVWE